MLRALPLNRRHLDCPSAVAPPQGFRALVTLKSTPSGQLTPEGKTTKNLTGATCASRAEAAVARDLLLLWSQQAYGLDPEAAAYNFPYARYAAHPAGLVRRLAACAGTAQAQALVKALRDEGALRRFAEECGAGVGAEGGNGSGSSTAGAGASPPSSQLARKKARTGARGRGGPARGWAKRGRAAAQGGAPAHPQGRQQGRQQQQQQQQEASGSGEEEVERERGQPGSRPRKRRKATPQSLEAGWRARHLPRRSDMHVQRSVMQLHCSPSPSPPLRPSWGAAAAGTWSCDGEACSQGQQEEQGWGGSGWSPGPGWESSTGKGEGEEREDGEEMLGAVQALFTLAATAEAAAGPGVLASSGGPSGGAAAPAFLQPGSGPREADVEADGRFAGPGTQHSDSQQAREVGDGSGATQHLPARPRFQEATLQPQGSGLASAQQLLEMLQQLRQPSSSSNGSRSSTPVAAAEGGVGVGTRAGQAFGPMLEHPRQHRSNLQLRRRPAGAWKLPPEPTPSPSPQGGLLGKELYGEVSRPDTLKSW